VAEVQLPQLGESVTEGIITAWLVKPGDTVTVDQPIVEISTDKVDTEIPSPVAGTITELRADVDATVQVGQVIVVIDETAAPATATPTPAAPAASTPAPAPQPSPAPTPKPAASSTSGAARVVTSAPVMVGAPRAAVRSPLIRRMLAAAGLPTSAARPTGRAGIVTRADAQRALQSRGTAGGGARTPRFDGARRVVEPLSRIRRAIAASMLRSLQTTAQLTAAVEVDVTSLMNLRETHKDAFRAAHGVGLSPLPMIARVVCEVLGRHPVLNSSIDTDAGTVTYHDYINLGIAVDTDRGLLVPNIKDAQALDVTGMALAIADVAARSRERSLTPDDITAGTFTITNTGSRGTLFDTPILNPPEVAILATCAIEKRPVVVNDGISDSVAIRWMTYLCLSYDHRMVDGADAARFLTDLKDALETIDLTAEVAAA
jgi:pyruvate dehydrogenase E2 component (dihydrolipoamide acetyltransferase)